MSAAQIWPLSTPPSYSSYKTLAGSLPLRSQDWLFPHLECLLPSSLPSPAPPRNEQPSPSNDQQSVMKSSSTLNSSKYPMLHSEPHNRPFLRQGTLPHALPILILQDHTCPSSESPLLSTHNFQAGADTYCGFPQFPMPPQPSLDHAGQSAVTDPFTPQGCEAEPPLSSL